MNDGKRAGNGRGGGPRARLDRWAARHPRQVLAIGAAMMAWLAWLSGSRLLDARLTVTSGWAGAVAVGVASPLVLVSAYVYCARRRWRSPAIWLILALAALFLGGFLYSLPALGDHGMPPVPVSTVTQVGALAVTATASGGVALLCAVKVFAPARRLARASPAVTDTRPGRLTTAVIYRRRRDWSVLWVGRPPTPPGFRAASLTDAAARVSAEVERRRPTEGQSPDEEETLLLAIYPWRHRGGGLLEVSGSPGSLQAHDVRGVIPDVAGATLEELVAACERIPTAKARRPMLMWARGTKPGTPDAS